ncbi:DUF6498-containing protein [Opitutus sp. GAS368]|uniref:DUF6498-containing protein n=1 Tax=Opitutus sp. GAS368 TaxID=1882749 RepID=UPI000879B5E2|nr:DUF6498-containing protein [Opitutus sp. GAS368]SDS20857.1 hypothetical protein SAMN05444173_2202 [Opitutus sp. GAS368]
MTAGNLGTEVGDRPGNRWADAWPDALAFAAGLGMAWYFKWETRDLVWSLWLSSLVVGYAMIVWDIFSPGMLLVTKVWGDRAMLSPEPKGPAIAGGAVLLVGGLFMLAFFTVHFGGFHFVHSVFLNVFFPLGPVKNSWPNAALYLQVLRDYWPFVLVAAVAERKAFRLAPAEPAGPEDTSVTAAAIAARKARNAQAAFASGGLMAPYKNVVRLHCLIFFFAAAHFAKLDNFLVYAVVYAVYFFPWRLLKKG